MKNTVIAVYDSYTQAQNARNELLASGFSSSDVQLNPEAGRETFSQTQTAREGGQSHGIGHFFRSLFGMEENREHGDVYSEAMRRGSYVVTVATDDEQQLERVTDIMGHHDPVDINERASHWRSQGWSGYDERAPMLSESEIEKERNLYAQQRGVGATQTTGETRIPVIEEELKVGKRVVQRGGVRIYQHVTERSVQETVDLREEHVKVERHPVDQPASEADLAAFKEGTVEVREMAEEPVVSKTAHVVEEVVIGKEVTEETANIDETLRKTEVEVEQLGPSGAAATPDDTDFRTHWQNVYGQAGGRYEDYDAAYRYGSTMAGSGRFKNYRWEDVEPDVRSDWESSHPGSSWEKVKDAVRYGAERVTGRQQH